MRAAGPPAPAYDPRRELGGNPPGWTPDLVKNEEKLILAVLFRF